MMKKLLLSLTLGAGLMLASCGEEKEAADIKTDDLETACDCVDALNTIADRMIELLDKEDDKDAEAEYEKLEEKMKEVGKHCTTEFKKEDAQECDGYDDIAEKMKKVR